MSACCGSNTVFDGLSAEYKRRLWIVIGINGAMFIVELIAGWIAQSKALQADSLDFFGDFLTYSLSLAVIGYPIRTRSNVAIVKGISLMLMGSWILITTGQEILTTAGILASSGTDNLTALPEAQTMGFIGLLALLANLTSVLVLVRYKDGDANVRSVWLCSRNDAIGNVAVMIAALGCVGYGNKLARLYCCDYYGIVISLFCCSHNSTGYKGAQSTRIALITLKM